MDLTDLKSKSLLDGVLHGGRVNVSSFTDAKHGQYTQEAFISPALRV
jgi:hypothetical protein